MKTDQQLYDEYHNRYGAFFMTDIQEQVKADAANLKGDAVKAEGQVQSWYAAHLPAITGGAGLVIGALLGHFVR